MCLGTSKAVEIILGGDDGRVGGQSQELGKCLASLPGLSNSVVW